MTQPKLNVWYDEWVQNLPSLEGKVVAITGCTSGTGYWAAVAAVRKNAKAVLLLNRKSVRSEAAAEKLEATKASNGSNTELINITCDLMDFNSVRDAARQVNEVCLPLGGLNVLLNNAGLLTLDERTKDGFDVQIQTNHLSHFLLTKLVMPSLQRASENGGDARVVQHSSAARNIMRDQLEKKYFVKSNPKTLGGNGFYACFKRYHQTKLSNSVFMLKLKREFDVKKINVKSLCAEPGAADTDWRTTLASKDLPLLTRFQAQFFSWIAHTFISSQSAADGSLPMIEAGFGVNSKSGDFFVPDNGSTGKPIKIIAAGEVMFENKNNEALTFDNNNQENVWKWSEEALGEKFFL